MTRAACVLVAAGLCTSPAWAQVDERVIHASVVDGRGEAVLGLNANDFVVREDGVAREVLSVAKDEDPLQIALLIDNSIELRNRLGQLRKALSSFVDGLRPGIQLSLITLAERPTIVVSYTSDRGALQKGIQRVVALEAGNHVLDGIAEVAEGLAKRPAARSVIAVVTARGPEYSVREYSDVLRIVRDSGMPALHAMVVGGTEVDLTMMDGQPASAVDFGDHRGGIGRDIVLGRLTRETGGRYEEVLSISALPAKLQQMAKELSNQYRVTYASPTRLIPAKTTVISARDPKLKARGK